MRRDMPALDLPRRRARYRVGDVDDLRHFEVRQAPQAVLLNLRRGGRCLQYDRRVHFLAVLGVRGGKGHSLGDGGMLEQSGVHVKQTLPHLGAVIGVGDESKVHELEAVAGVETVRPEASFTLPRMDDDVPQ